MKYLCKTCVHTDSDTCRACMETMIIVFNKQIRKLKQKFNEFGTVSYAVYLGDTEDLSPRLQKLADKYYGDS